MPDAEFEEREYEAPLYNQLEHGSRKVWSPGQVFESHIGIDRAMFIVDDLVFRLHGHPRYLSGAVLANYVWPLNWFKRRTRTLPNFRLNLFLQAKRPKWGRRPPAHVATRGVPGNFWKFNIDSSQQKALQIVANRLIGRALVVYAAPAFHELRFLYRHTRTGTIVENSTFPSVAALTGHSTWYYNKPGAVGVANPNAIFIEEPPILDRLDSMIHQLNRNADVDDTWRASLQILADGIMEALSSPDLPDTARRAQFFNRQREIDHYLTGIDEHLVITQYLTVFNFADTFAFDWYVVGLET